MHVRVLQDFSALELAQILVEDGHSEEVSSDRALERRGHLDHPIHHLGAILLANVVCVEWRWLCFVDGDQVSVDF